MASLPHTPTSSTPNSPGADSSSALDETSREAGARFASRESTPPPSAIQHSFRPARDIVSGSGFHGHPRQGGGSSNGRTLEEMERSPPGAFPGDQEEKEVGAREEVKHAVTAIRVYAKSHLPASLGTYIDTDKEEDQPHEEHADAGSSSTTSGESSAVTPEECDASAHDQSGSNNGTGASHNTNPFRDPEFMRTHGSHSAKDSISEESRSKWVSPETARPSSYVDEPSASTYLYADTSAPPTRTYDMVRDALTGQPEDISSGFGRSLRSASLVEPIITARAVPAMAGPPLVVYSNTSVPMVVATEEETVEIVEQSEEFVSRPSEDARPIGSAFYEDEQGEALVPDGTPSESPALSDQEEGESEEGEEVYESPHECDTEAKEKPKGFLSKLTKWFRGKSSSKDGKRSKEESPADLPESPLAEGVGPDDTTAAPETHGRTDSPPSEIPSSTSRKERPICIAETPVASTSKGTRLKSIDFRHRAHLDIIPKHVPEHFDETIGPLPRHVEMRGKRELPTRERPGGSRVGVGSLPGRRDEAGVARLPDERNSTIASAASLGRAREEQVFQTTDRDDIDVGTSQTSEVSRRSSSSLSSSSSSEGSAEQDNEPQSGFLSGLLWETEEVLRDLGDVALYYVPGFGYPSEEDSDVGTPTTPESREEPSASPSPVSAATPTRAPPSSPVVGFQTEPRQESSEGTSTAARAAPPMPDPRPLEEQLSAPADPDRLATPMDPPPSHPSRSSSADVVNPEVSIVGPPSTQERISGRQEEVASPLMREYVKSPSLEDAVDVGGEGSLPGYPSEGGLRALIGERMYDDEMRAAGAEPVERATSSLQPEQRQEEHSATEAPTEKNEPEPKVGSEQSQAEPSECDKTLSPPVSVSSSHKTTTKGFDVKGLGPPLAEEKKRVFKQPRKEHN